MKRFLVIFLSLLLTVYLGFFFCMFQQTEIEKDNHAIELVYMDTLGPSLLTKDNVMRYLTEVDTLSVPQIEYALSKHVLVSQVECYQTNNGTMKCLLWCKEPVARVMADAGNFYLCRGGEFLNAGYVHLNLPLLTGCADSLMCSTWGEQLCSYIHDHEFWNNQIEQINVQPNGNVVIVPRIGAHFIDLGSGQDYVAQLERLMNFYRQGLNKIGWNKYSNISLAYSNQIVCKTYKSKKTKK